MRRLTKAKPMSMADDLYEVVERSTYDESVEGERRINYARFVLISLFVPVHVSSRIFYATIRSSIHNFDLLAIALTIGVCIAIHAILKRNRYFPWLKYAAISMDFLLVTALLLIRTFARDPLFLGAVSDPIFFILFLIAASNSLRFSFRSSIYCAVSGSVLIILLTFIDHRYNVVSLNYLRTIVVIVIFSLSTLVAGIAVQRFKHLIVKEVQRQKERDFVKSTFSRYVTSQVVDAILGGKVELGGEERTVSILFSDIRGFTALSSRLKSREVVSFLNEYLSLMVDIIFEFEGTLDKFMGDGILAVFGAPITKGKENDATRAILTALRMRERLVELNDKRIKSGELPIKIGVAIHTGEVVVGNVGSDKRMEYTVIGDPVNLCSRMEGLNKRFGTDILLSENTYKLVKDVVEVREIPGVEVRGKKEAITVYSVS